MDIFFLLIGLVGLYFGAEWLVSGSSQLALKAGISPLVIGLTVVALGTSAPELAVCLSLNFNESPNAAIGNIVGSNICNILLILGFSGLVMPLAIHRQVLRKEIPILLLVSLMFVFMLEDKRLSLLEGCLLVAGIVVYIASNFRFLGKSSSADNLNGGEPIDKINRSFRYLFFLIIFGLGLLVVGADYFQKGGIGIARSLGVSDAVIGLTVLAFGTSLPELATSIVACIKKQGDLIAGNAIGSSVFNVLAILGITVVAKPMPQVEGIHTQDLIFMVGSVILAGALMMGKLKLGRCKGSAMIVAYILYVVLIVRRP